MTSANAVLLVRSILDENGVTAGYFDNTLDIYPWLNAGRNEIININILFLRKIREKVPLYQREILKPLIKVNPLSTTTTGAGLQEYALPADYLETDFAEYDSAGGTARKLCTILNFSEIQFRQANTYEAATALEPVMYVREKKIGFYPQPTGAGAAAYQHYYYYQPADVASGVEFILMPETHNAIVIYAVAMGLQKDGQHEAAALQFKKFYEMII